MGLEIERESFTEDDHRVFLRRLEASLVALERVLCRPGFGEGPLTIGAEVELDLVGDDALPLPEADRVLAELGPAFTTEICRFNLEHNAPPLALAGRAFEALERGFEDAVSDVRRVAAAVGGRPIAIGILPTIREADLDGSMLSDKPRYRALSNAIKCAQGGLFRLAIQGRETLETTCDEVTAEGANTSLQVHLRCSPHGFASTFNAAQLVMAPLVAVSANAPIFLGRVLWDETRIALSRQATDDRPGASEDDWRPARVSFGHGWVRRGALELFAEAVAMHPPLLPVLGAEDPLAVVARGDLPALSELRLHQGTVWHWNRAIYDPSEDGHLRIEMRAMPSGPTPADMAANAALAVGATLALREEAEAWLAAMPFHLARRNFYEAARSGLEARLLWPRRNALPALRRASDVVLELCDRAESALVANGVVAGDASRALAIARRRARSGQNGAAWQRQAFDMFMTTSSSREAASARLTEAYAARAAEGTPVAEWSTARPA